MTKNKVNVCLYLPLSLKDIRRGVANLCQSNHGAVKSVGDSLQQYIDGELTDSQLAARLLSDNMVEVPAGTYKKGQKFILTPVAPE